MRWCANPPPAERWGGKRGAKRLAGWGASPATFTSSNNRRAGFADHVLTPLRLREERDRQPPQIIATAASAKASSDLRLSPLRERMARKYRKAEASLPTALLLLLMRDPRRAAAPDPAHAVMD